MDPITGIVAGAQVLNSLGSLTGSNARRSAALNYRYWKKQFDYAAAYNAPSAVRQRLIDGQYNPALAVGNLGLTQTASPQMGNASASDYESPNLVPSLLQFQQISNAKAQEENIRAETDLKRQEFRFNEENNPIRSGQLQSNLLGSQYRNEYQRIVNENQPVVNELRNEGLNLQNQQTKKFISQMDEKHRKSMSLILAEMSAIAHQNDVRDSQTTLNKANTSSARMDVLLKDFERELNQSGSSKSDNPVFRQIQQTATRIKNWFQGDSKQKQRAERQSSVLQWVLDPQSK